MSPEDMDLLQEFVAESLELLSEASEKLIECEQADSDEDRRELLHSIFRNVHSIKGNSAFFGLNEIMELAHRTEHILDELRSDRLTFNERLLSGILKSVDLLIVLVQGVFDPSLLPSVKDLGQQQILLAELKETNECIDPAIYKLLSEVCGFVDELDAQYQAPIQQLITTLQSPRSGNGEHGTESLKPSQVATETRAAKPTAPADTAASVEESPAEHSEQKKSVERRIMRIDEQRIDAFLGYVGELVVVGDMFAHCQRQLNSAESSSDIRQNLAQVIGTFGQLSSKLQQAIMSVRTVPAKQLLRKAPKLVRDIATEQEKKIRVEISGEEIEIDKGYIDLLDAPLVHMVRNAADHGIESPVDRLQAGKDETGRIAINLRNDQDSVVFELIDDGGGINRQRIAEKAIKLGIITEGQELDEATLIECMFTAGVSTAEKVSNISGRGVGMDVVRRAIEQAGGRINVQSDLGLGTTFTISLPRAVTTQIGMGYFVRCGSEFFILDLERVQETFLLKESPISSPGGPQFVQRREQSLLVMDIKALLAADSTATAPDEANQVAVVAMVKQKVCAVLVDEVIGIKQMVKLPLEIPGCRNLPYQGVAAQGDGSLALILDLDDLSELLP